MTCLLLLQLNQLHYNHQRLVFSYHQRTYYQYLMSEMQQEKDNAKNLKWLQVNGRRKQKNTNDKKSGNKWKG